MLTGRTPTCSQGGHNGPFDIIEPPDDPARSKATIYRNGREVPFVVAGPGTKKNVQSDDQVNVVDLYATVLDFVDVPQPQATQKSSFSFAGSLKGYSNQRKINVSELYPATATVGGTNPVSSGRGGPFGPGGRAVGDDRYSLLAFNRVGEDGFFVCKEGSGTRPEEDCFNNNTGIYERVVDLSFYDVEADPQEENPLLFKDLDMNQKEAFIKLCDGLNELGRDSVYYQNGDELCKVYEVSTNPMM